MLHHRTTRGRPAALPAHVPSRCRRVYDHGRMLEYLLIGGGFAFAAAAQPGPLQAFYLSKVASGGWRRTLPACLAPVISDGPIAVVILSVLHRLPEGFENYLKAGGGLLLL